MNYRSTRSERAVRRAISEGIRLGSITREQVIVCTKGGYLTFGNEKPADPRRWVQETYVKTGLFTWSDFVAGCHCMTPAYLKNQVKLEIRCLAGFIYFWFSLFLHCVLPHKSHGKWLSSFYRHLSAICYFSFGGSLVILN